MLFMRPNYKYRYRHRQLPSCGSHSPKVEMLHQGSFRSHMESTNTKTFMSNPAKRATGTLNGEGIEEVFTVNTVNTSSETIVEAKSILVQANTFAVTVLLRSVADLISVRA